MITLRHFADTDAGVIQKYRSPDMTVGEIQQMISDWNRLSFQGRYFEMFAVEEDGRVVGSISLYHNSASVLSIGPEVFPPFRRRGIGKEAMTAAMKIAKDKGYRIVCQQVQSDNTASMALHTGLGFESDFYGYTNRKGREVFLFLKLL